MAKLNLTYKVQGTKEIKEVTKALETLSKAIDSLKKKGIHLDVYTNGKKRKM